MGQWDSTKKAQIGTAVSIALLTLVLSMIPGRLKKREDQKYFNEVHQITRSLGLENLRDQYSPIATLLADNAYVTNIRSKSGSSRIYYAGLLRDQIREFFETHTLIRNILVHLDDVPIIIDKNYILLEPEPEELISYIGYDPFFPNQIEVSLGRNCQIMLPDGSDYEYEFQNGDGTYLQFEFPRYIADTANAEVQFNIDYEQIVRHTLGTHFDNLVALYLVQQRSDSIYPLFVNPESFGVDGLSYDNYLSKEWLDLLAQEIHSGSNEIISLEEQKHRIIITPAGAGLVTASLWDPTPPGSPLNFLSYVIYGVTALWVLLLFVLIFRSIDRAKRKKLEPHLSFQVSENDIKHPLHTDQSALEITEGATEFLESETEDTENDIRSYIDDHFADPDLNAKHLAEIFNYSEKHIYALWREQEEVSIGDYIQELRLNAAYELIIHGDDAINDIAQQTGFSSYNTFYKAFRRKFDQTPSQIRREHRSR